MKKVLLATDFSSNAKNAIRYALDLFNYPAYHGQVEFLLVHAQPAPFTPISLGSPYVVSNPDVTDMVKAGDDLLKTEVEELQQLYPYAKIKSMHMLGDEITGINSLAEEQRIDLIVVGTLGKSMMERTLIGSTSVGIARHATCPVLVVPGKASFKPMQKMVLATDMQHLSNLNILDMMQPLVFNFEPEVYILHVFGEKEQLPENRELLNHALKIYFNTNKYRYYYLENENPVEGIGEFVSGHQADMLVLIGQNRNFFAGLFHRSVTKQVVLHSRIPILVLHQKIHEDISDTKSTGHPTKIQGTLFNLKKDLDELNLQFYLSKAEAADEITDLKTKIKTWVDKTTAKLENLDDDMVIRIKNALAKIKEKAADLKNDNQQAIAGQKEQLRFHLNKIQELLQGPIKEKGALLKGRLEESMDQLKANLDEMMLEINLGKMEIREEWLEKESDLRKKIHEIRHRLNLMEETTGEKWQHIKKEMSSAAQHVKKAFAETH